ncbi:DNA-3-methyladenine glycosylase [Granulicella sp. L46]|uniref:DNA-3-methyladenine glycosylase n=1 Tax=Granulicella sp. L46 TaxID=1641865 RepID=UPI00131DFA3B|nr:DNA-3-methyladenine glycosylase [Granulicella sp. L46]
MPTLLPRSFYLDSPDIVARNLLGKLITRNLNGERLTGRITEIEAYLGLSDPASHSFIGKTARNAVLFGPPGFSYVYFIYGMHYCLNFSCQPEGEPGGVLIRALQPVAGLDTMARLRGLASPVKPKLLCSGPGRLCEALGITLAENGLDVTRAKSPLRVLDDGFRPTSITATPRIGISKAVDMPLRFLMTAPDPGALSSRRSHRH